MLLKVRLILRNPRIQEGQKGDGLRTYWRSSASMVPNDSSVGNAFIRRKPSLLAVLTGCFAAVTSSSRVPGLGRSETVACDSPSMRTLDREPLVAIRRKTRHLPQLFQVAREADIP